MLVHALNPKQVLKLGHYSIYGRALKRPATDIPFDLYYSNREILECGTYRLGSPEVAFTYDEVRWLPDKTLDMLGTIMVDGFKKSWSHKHKVDSIKIEIRDVAKTA